jgi:hypothetical protein
VFLVGCDEHDERHHFAFQHRNDAEAVQFRHLQIESFAPSPPDAGPASPDVFQRRFRSSQVGSGGPLVIRDDHACALSSEARLASVPTRFRS